MNKRIKVLLVDDETDFTQPIKFWLESRGYSVAVAPNGQNAIKIIKEDLPDIVFLDLKMPVMDGVETLRKIRGFNKKLPVVIITVEYANEKKFAETMALGSSGFFPKKESFAELEKMIETTLKTHKQLKEKQ